MENNPSDTNFLICCSPRGLNVGAMIPSTPVKNGIEATASFHAYGRK